MSIHVGEAVPHRGARLGQLAHGWTEQYHEVLYTRRYTYIHVYIIKMIKSHMGGGCSILPHIYRVGGPEWVLEGVREGCLDHAGETEMEREGGSNGV